ncbi:hypothetical protein Q5752_002988 [Cryptotrichosporon argae]
MVNASSSGGLEDKSPDVVPIPTVNQPEEDASVADRMKRLEAQYDETGMRRSVEAVIIVHEFGVPCILTLQVAADFFKLPGGYIDPSETDAQGLDRLLSEQLGTGAPTRRKPDGSEWGIRQCLGMWYRPNFDGFFYPYVPAHITKPKERKKVFLVTPRENQVIGVPINMKLLGVPLHEYYDNTQRYGPQLSALPHMLSRFTFAPQYYRGMDEGAPADPAAA